MVAVAAAALSTSSGAALRGPATSQACPVDPVPSSSAVEAMEAVKKLLIDGQTITAGGITRKLTTKNTFVYAIVRLAPASDPYAGPVAGAATLRAVASKRCGAKLAAQSWGVEMYYSVVNMLSASRGRSFVVKTRHGWRAY